MHSGLHARHKGLLSLLNKCFLKILQVVLTERIQSKGDIMNVRPKKLLRDLSFQDNICIILHIFVRLLMVTGFLIEKREIFLVLLALDGFEYD
jgi:cytochrome c biogenesis protein CcdA